MTQKILFWLTRYHFATQNLSLFRALQGRKTCNPGFQPRGGMCALQMSFGLPMLPASL